MAFAPKKKRALEAIQTQSLGGASKTPGRVLWRTFGEGFRKPLPDSTQKVSQSLLGASWRRLPKAFARFNAKGLPESSGSILEETSESLCQIQCKRSPRVFWEHPGRGFRKPSPDSMEKVSQSLLGGSWRRLLKAFCQT